MSEDYIIQQQPSAAPYALGGAVVGGGTAAALSNWGPQWAKEKAKYASFEDILKESKDDFVKNNEGIAEQAVTDLETARTAINKAGTDYDAQLAEYLEKNKAGATPELPADAKELADLKEAQTKLAAKRAELEKLKAEEIRKAGTGKTITPKQQKAIDKLTKEIEKSEKDLELLTEQLKAKSKGYEKLMNNYADKLEAITRANPKITEAELVQADVEAAKNILKTEKGLEEVAEPTKPNRADYGNKTEFDKANSKYKQELKKYTEYQEQLKAQTKKITLYRQDIMTAADINGAVAKDEIADIAAKRAEAFENVKLVTDQKIEGKSAEETSRILERNIKAQEAKITKLKDFQTKYAEWAAKAPAEEVKAAESLMVKGKLFRLIPFLGEVKSGSSAEIVKEFAEVLSAEEKKTFERLVGESGGDVKKAIEKAIANRNEDISALTSARETISRTNTRIAELGGEGAKIEKGKLVDAAGKEVTVEPKKVKFTEGFEVPESQKMAKLRRNIEGKKRNLESMKVGKGTALTEEQIAEQAKKAVTDDMLKAEQEAVTTAQKAVDEARTKLPKAEGKPAEELTKEFVEKHGTREKAIEEATNAQKEKIGNELKALFEKGKIKGGKLAWITAAGVGAGALIGLMFKPKNETV